MLGEKLKEIRKSKKLNQAEIGNLLGVSNKTISKYENGERNISTAKLLQFCKLFNITPNEILGVANKPQRKKKREVNRKDLSYIPHNVD